VYIWGGHLLSFTVLCRVLSGWIRQRENAFTTLPWEDFGLVAT
jgi:hypothetical protein